MAGCATANGADCFLASGFCDATGVLAGAAFAPDTEVFIATFFGGVCLPLAVALLTFTLATGFFGVPAPRFFSVNSNAGLGRDLSRGMACGPMRVISAAGFTPAAAAAFA